MNSQQLAEILSGRQYGEEIRQQECEDAKSNGLLVAFGYSDDGIKLRGVINDEYGAWQGTSLYLCKDKHGDFFCPKEDEMDVLRKVGVLFLLIRAIWLPDKINASWLITTSAPCSTFEIMEGDDLFCQGIVVDCNAL